MRLRHSHEVDTGLRRDLRALLDEAFAGDFSDDDFDHALGGVHVFAEDDDGVVGHASVVQRQLIADGVVLRTGFVEAVAVAARARRRGIGDTLMDQIDGIIARAYDLGALGASDVGRPLYLRRGWLPWTGRLAALTPDGVVSTPDDEGGVLVLSVPGGPTVDLTGTLVADWRRGAPW